MAKRPALSRERVVDAAATVADAGGLAQVSMRNVGRELGVEAMSLYHHVDGKEALLDALVEWVFGQIELPDPATPWRPAMASRAASARSVLAAHPWALGLIESRTTPLDALLQHHESVLASLRGNGFSVSLAAHAFSVIDAYVYGFVQTEMNLPFEPGEGADAFIHEFTAAAPLERYPHMAEMIAEQIVGRSYEYGSEFEFGLDLILQGLERHLAAETG